MTARALLLVALLAASARPAAAAEPPTIPPPPSQLEPIGQVNGTVFDRSHKGAVGLPVSAIPQSGAMVHGTSTDSSGRFAFKGLEADTYSVVVSVPPHGVLRKDGIRIRPLFRSIVDFTLSADIPASSLPAVGAAADGAPPDATFALVCRMSGPDREPVADAVVSVIPVRGQGRFGRGITGHDGAVTIPDLPPGTYRIVARAPGFLTWSVGPIPLRGTAPLTLALNLVPFPMGFEGTIEDLLIPADPIPPAGSPAAPTSN